MSPPLIPEERNLLAAELALGVLEGDDLIRARELSLSSPGFATAVEGWKLALAPIADEASPIEAEPGVWERIQEALVDPAAPVSTIVQLQRKLRVWQAVSFASFAAAAAALLIVTLPRSSERPSPQRPSELLLASLSSEQTGTSVSAAYNSASGTLLVSPALLKGAAGHEHELWVIPQGGEPVPVGLIAPGPAQRLPVRPAIAPHFHANSTLAISVEPVGGSPTGKPTGPVIATGRLSVI
jgi:anti-sigma-K factor RskA